MNPFTKSSLRTIKTSLTRFFSILLISFIGAGVFAGLVSIGPNMKQTGNNYFKQYNVMDVNLVSTFGFNNEDVEIIKQQEEVLGVMPSYFIDALGDADNYTHTFQLKSLPNNYNSKNDNYINQFNIVEGRMPKNNNEIIIIKPSTGLKNIKVGSKISLDKNSNELLSDFLDNYTYEVVGIAESPYHLAFLQGNTTLGSGVIDFVLYLPEENFIIEYYTNIYITLKNSKNYDLFSNKYNEYVENFLNTIKPIQKNRETLIHDQLHQELADGIKQYEDGLNLFNESKILLKENENKFNLGKKLAEKKLNKSFEEIKLEFPKMKKDFNQLKGLYNLKLYLEELKNNNDPNYQVILNLYNLAIIESGYTKEEIEQLYIEIPTLEEGINNLEQLIEGEQLLIDGYKQLIIAETELEKGKITIDEASKKLNNMMEPRWYLLSKEFDESFSGYKNEINNMWELSKVFPVVFFLVAALVSLTTMTRMVDEDRILIGTFKSLGYSNVTIGFRYINYAVLASSIGSLLGVFVGSYIIPKVIWNSYKIVFMLPQFTYRLYLWVVLVSVLVTVLVIGLTTLFSVKNLLKENPAQLMRPKAPKKGRKTLIEKNDKLWKKLNFSQKITIRNLSLNIKRLILTFVGIVGCTSLVLTAFGAKEAIDDLINSQFEHIYLYDTIIGYNEENKDFDKFMKDQNNFEASEKIYYTYSKVESDNTKKSYDIFLMSPEDSKNFNNIIGFYQFPKNKPFIFNDDSVVITNKLADNLKVKVGDKIVINDLKNNSINELIVTDITLNYTLNHVYIGKNAFLKAYDKEAPYNQYFAAKNELISKEELKEKTNTFTNISTFSYVDDMMGNINTTIKSVDTIVLVLIVASGLLAFVVLYNLANINIGERHREIATLKVLGFYDNETNSYVFKEIYLLNIVSSIIGLFFGVLLYRAVIETLEPDMLYLTRHLSWQTYVYAFLLTLIFGVIANQIIKPKVKKVDMLESLKSVE